MATVGIQAFTATLPHGVHQSSNGRLGDVIPLLLKPSQQLTSIGGRRMIRHQSPTKLIPQMLDWVEIRADGRPGQPVHSCLLNEGIDGSGTVWPSVVVLEDGIMPDLLESRDDQRLQNFRHVPVSIQVPIDVVEGSPVVPADAAPYHYRSPAKGISLLNGIVCQLLATSPPDTNAAIRWL